MAFINTNITNNKEKDKMKKIFDAIDVNFDGKLTKAEVIGGLQKMGMDNAK